MGRPNWKHVAEGAILPLAILLIWQTVCSLGYVSPLKLPSPIAVVLRMGSYIAPEKPFDSAVSSWPVWLISSEFLRDAAGSVYRVAAGFVVGAGLALPLGLAMGASDRAYRMFNPLVQIHRPIPPVAYIPLSILWFGLGNPPAIFLIAIGAFFPVLINTIAGVRAVDSIYLRAARNLGASQMTIFLRVILPAAMPYILSGVRIGIGVAFIVVIIAEALAVTAGLGYRITESREYSWIDKVIAGMYGIGLIGFAIDLVITRLNAYLLRWHRGMESQ